MSYKAKLLILCLHKLLGFFYVYMERDWDRNQIQNTGCEAWDILHQMSD